MPIGHLSIRIDTRRRDHHVWVNHGGGSWVHSTRHFDGRNRRIRRSLGTRDLEQAIRLRDERFDRIREYRECVAPRRRADDEPGVLPMLVPRGAGAPAAWWTMRA